MKKKICVIGLGYIGLPTASLLATKGMDVLGVDIKPETVNCINNGEIHISEPDLDVLVSAAVSSGKLKASLKPTNADIFIIAVPTPILEDKKPDISHVLSAAKEIASYLEKGSLLIVESTIPVGTTQKVASTIQSLRKDLSIPINENDSGDIFIAYCPERVLPSQILKELIDNDRIIGGINNDSSLKAKEFYKSFIKGECHLTNSKTAELAKLTENSYRDVQIAFANELSMISGDLEIDVWELIKLTNHHPRVKILNPGPGVGGHCIAVDPWFLIDSAPEKSTLLKAAREINDKKPEYIVNQIKEKISQTTVNKICFLGLSYKPNVDDVRQSPSISIIKPFLNSEYGMITIVDPFIKKLPQFFEKSGYAQLSSLKEALLKCDMIVSLVHHDAFDDISKDQLKNKILIDTCGLWNKN